MLRSRHLIVASSRALRQFVVALLVGAAVLVVASLLAMPLRGLVGRAGVHLTMAALALLAIATLGQGRWADYGLRLPRTTRWRRAAVGALALGALASITMVPLTLDRMAPLADLSFLRVVALTWLLASVAEELLARGWVQGHLTSMREIKLHLGPWQLTLPTVIGALFFSAMHVGLLMNGTGPVAAVVVLLYTFLLGLLAGHSRARSGSLVPAIVLHALANVGGMVGGIIATTITALLTGRPPAI